MCYELDRRNRNSFWNNTKEMDSNNPQCTIKMIAWDKTEVNEGLE